MTEPGAHPSGTEPATVRADIRSSTGRVVTVVVLAVVALLTVGFLIGYAVTRGDDRTPTALVEQVPTLDSVEAGFARDMITHHNQGITMAHYGEIDSDDAEIQRLAYDINATQLAQVGQMQGWLALWQLPEQAVGPRMAWMGTARHEMAGMGITTAPAGSGATGTAADLGFQALMPGMATSGEMDLLKTLQGRESDVYFLQLMVRHHQGGQVMMEYASQHATNPIVRNFAFKMIEAQEGEVAVMTQLLQARGAAPLPFTPAT